MSWRICCGALGAVILGALPCVAAPRDPAAAEELFRTGRAAAERGEIRLACEHFEESYRLDPTTGTLLNLADCRQSLGQLASAWAHYKHALEILRPDDDRLPELRQRLAALEPRIPKLTLYLRPHTPRESTVTRDGISVARSSLGMPIPVDPGQHVVVVTLRAHAPRTYHLAIKEGETQEQAVEPGERLEAPRALTSVPRAQQRAAPMSSPARTAGYLALGAGAASLAAAAIVGWRYSSARTELADHCPTPSRCDDRGVRAAGRAETLETALIVSGAAAVAGVATGLALLVWVAPAQNTANATGSGHAVRAVLRVAF